MYGHGDIWGASPNWRRGLSAPGARDLTVAKGFFDALPWHHLQPDLDSLLLVEGQSEFGDDEWITSALTQDRSLAVIYVPRAMSRMSRRERLAALLSGDLAGAWTGLRRRFVKVDVSHLSGDPVAEWFSPATGDRQRAESDSPPGASGVRVFAVPCTTNREECDAALVLRVKR
jgi:hypothetical protein